MILLTDFPALSNVLSKLKALCSMAVFGMSTHPAERLWHTLIGWTDRLAVRGQNDPGELLRPETTAQLMSRVCAAFAFH